MLRLLRADPATADLPFIFVTSVNHQEIRVEAMELGVTEIITKPFTLNEILASLERLGINAE